MKPIISLVKYLSLGFFGCIMMAMIFDIHQKITGENDAILVVTSVIFWAMYIGFNIVDKLKSML